MRRHLLLVLLLGFGFAEVCAASKHSAASRFMSYEGRVMCGYQGWFRAAGDGSGRGWAHYGRRGRFDPENLTIDLWPDVSEYTKLYPTVFKHADGSPAQVFSSWDAETLDLHFRWMKDYGIDGVFMQRFFNVTRTARSRARGRVILGHALTASRQHGRAIAVMYDLSGLRADGESCDSVIQDWKELVDGLKVTSMGTDQTYLYHRGKPLVAIWGLGFPDRPYDIRKIGFERLLEFLKNDPDYGGCSVMLGVPTYFRELERDAVNDPYLHEIMNKADIILPWMVGRFRSRSTQQMKRYGDHVRADIDWCAERGLDYVPCVYPGFSWHNLRQGREPLGAIPRHQGRFYWDLIHTALQAEARMLYVAMFDEIDEGTAIMKCSNTPPRGANTTFLDYEGMPADHYLWLTGQGGKMLRGDMPPRDTMPTRQEP